jgi:toxin CptA
LSRIPRQQIELIPSRYLAFILVASHGAAIAASLLVFPLWAGGAVSLMLLLGLRHYVLRDAWLCLPHSCAGLVLEEEGAEIILRDGKRQPCRILPGSLASPWLTVLNILPEESRFSRSVVILPDSLDAEAFRQLRVWLKWRGQS